ncbi:MAG TPA: hypothetical protein DIT99_15490 [Candidatus Latescibacteria bacterium]|nr:hypothetical protein [Candidatus Latescibacterota bacterium]
MYTEEAGINFDPRFEDPEKLKALTRRGFLGRVMGGIAAGTALMTLTGRKATAAPLPADEPAEPNDVGYWNWVADQFVIRDDIAYMNTGTRGPSPGPVHRAQIAALEGINSDYQSYSRYVYNSEFRDNLRNKMANFIGCKSSEVAFTNNTTEGMVFGTFGIDMEPGDEIITTNHDHSGGVQPINLRAARQKTKTVMIDLSDHKFHPPDNPDELVKAFEAAITPRTKLISFCHINYTDGLLLPVKEICEMARARGILTLVDGAQPPGMLKMNMHDLACDMYAGPCHKWMLASMYTGFFYVREDIVDRVWPTVYSGPVNGLSMYGQELTGASKDYYEPYLAGAAKFELRGSSNAPARVAIDAALDFHNMITPEALEARNRYQAVRLANALRNIDDVDVYSSEDPRMSAALVSFKIKGGATRDLNARLWERNRIYIRNVTHSEINWDANRASMHVMVTDAQTDKLIDAVEEIAKEKRL